MASINAISLKQKMEDVQKRVHSLELAKHLLHAQILKMGPGFNVPPQIQQKLDRLDKAVSVANGLLEWREKHNKIATGGTRGNSRQRHQRQPRKLTAKQLEAVQVFAECEYNYSKTARCLGLSPSATRDRIRPAFHKLGQQVPRRPKTRQLPIDRDGQSFVAAGCQPAKRGDGKNQVSFDRRQG
jgi:DNA-binding CsgD family transcriptional regulator